MRKFICCWLIACTIFCLQSCQSNINARQEKALKAQHLRNAAVYNTQLGLAYLQKDDRLRAKHKLLTALDLAPNSADVNVAMGYFLEKTGDLDKATVFYKKALALAPHSGAQLNNYGTFLCRVGKYQEAEKYFLNAVGDVHYINTAGAYENAGLCATAVPDYSKALLYFTKALAYDPNRKPSLAEAVQIEMKLKHPKKALALLQQYKQHILNDEALLTLAINAAHQAGQFNVEKMFKDRLILFRARPLLSKVT